MRPSITAEASVASSIDCCLRMYLREVGTQMTRREAALARPAAAHRDYLAISMQCSTVITGSATHMLRQT